MNADALIAQLPEGDYVPLVELTAIVPEIDANIRNRMAREGIVRPIGKRAAHGRTLVSREDLVLVLVAVVLAACCGVAVIAIARMLRESGLDPAVLNSSMKGAGLNASVLAEAAVKT